MKLKVYITARGVTNYISSKLGANSIIDPAITIGDFFSKIVIVKKRKKIDPEFAIIALHHATQFEEYAKLGFERGFLSFIKNYQFISKFFGELFSENVSFNQISFKDIEGEFVEHIEILKVVYQKYVTLLDAHALYDSFYLPGLYINESYIKRFESIEIHASAYLTNSELELLLKVSQITPLILEITINQFNRTMFDKFANIGINLNEEGQYSINFTTREITLHETPELKEQVIESESFGVRSNQIPYIFSKLDEYIHVHNIFPENIAIILPDESFRETLSIYDEFRNLNFAMGLSVTKTIFYQKLNAILELHEDNNSENKARLVRVGADDIYEEFTKYFRHPNFEQFLRFIGAFEIDEDIKESVAKLIFRFEKLKANLEGLRFDELLWYFIEQLRVVSIDDIGGGRVKVIGVLESREAEFEAIIIPDFNEGVVPKQSQKDIFLNSKIKQLTSLPTIKDRENLQKFYYDRVIKSAKYIAITHLNNNETSPSRFLKHFSINVKENSDEVYENNLLHFNPIIKKEDRFEIASEIESGLSASKLKDFLTCKQKFYYRYIEKIESHSYEIEPKGYEIGVYFHEALKRCYNDKNSFSDVASLRRSVTHELMEYGENEFLRFDIELWIRRSERFFANEIKRFERGYRVFKNELSFKNRYKDKIILNGRIDRVDIKDEKLTILDYKVSNSPVSFKSLEKESLFGLEFYYHGIKAMYQEPIEELALYDVKRGVLIPDSALHERLDVLDGHITNYCGESWVIEKCEDVNVCKFCDYNVMCGRY